MENVFYYNESTKAFSNDTKPIKENNKSLVKTLVIGTLAVTSLSVNYPKHETVLLKNKESQDSKVITKIQYYPPTAERLSKVDVDTNAIRVPDDMQPRISSKGEDTMSEVSYTKNEIDLKIDNLNNKVDNKFELLTQKIDSGFSNQTLRIENQIQAFKLEQVQAKKDLTYWIIGTTLALIGVIVGALALF
ncbi:SH3 domain protein [Lactococcus cremoris]|nr:SH3 domain protein [Lactococcus cremoris]